MQEERDFAIQYLQNTGQQFVQAFSQLSTSQWLFKPDPETWSIAEIAEHIAYSESAIFHNLIENLKTASPNTPENLVESKAKETKMMQSVNDRSFKVKAPESIRPEGRWKNSEEVAQAFNKIRNHLIEYVKTTEDNLRSFLVPHPFFKQLDIYQWVLFIGGHCERHTAQINEVKSHPDFPQN